MSDAEGLMAVAVTGDRAGTLRALRDHLAATIEGASPRDLAALSARLVEVLDALEAVPAPAEGTVLDDLRRRRAARSAG